MVNLRLLACAFALALSACEAPTPTPAALTEAEVQEFVRQYAAVSSAADVPKIMGFIQRDETVTSAGVGIIYRGWNAIRAATDDAAAENALLKVELGKVDVTPLGADTALAVAPMTVSSHPPARDGSLTNAPGALSIVVKRTPEGLRIVHEHYSLKL
jgi:ketosteroid isomerase-like protein